MKTDILVVGGGFFGCNVALYHAKKHPDLKITLLESSVDLMQKASYINQARVHSGFHYPRSRSTLISCLENYKRFVTDYEESIVKEFTNYYAIAKEGSKISSSEFYDIYREVNAPIKPAQLDLVNPSTVDAVFEVEEFAFDAKKLRQKIKNELKQHKNIKVRLGVAAQSISNDIVFTNIGAIQASRIFLCLYHEHNKILEASQLAPLNLNFEVAEMAKVRVPESLSKLSFTLMDGPFFSLYPFPAENCYTLSHVTHTVRKESKNYLSMTPPRHSNIYRMLEDAKRFLPEIANVEYAGSLYCTKALLPKNEMDDGRPILFKQQPDNPYIFNVIGGKLDNVYDLLKKLDNMDAHNIVESEV